MTALVPVPAGDTPAGGRLGLGLAMAALVVALDQFSKWWILEVVMQPPHVVEVTPFCNFVLAWNQGVSFGMFAHAAVFMPFVLSAVALAIVVTMVAWLRTASRPLAAAALGLVIGGALGNVVDRLRFGAVADFIDAHWAGWHFWTFNVADSAISIGVALLVIDGLFSGPEKA
jgi:signal peptidase II